MPSRKQRRRRQKLKRHEYEYVVETEEGEEIAVDRLSEVDETRKDGKKAKAPVDRRGRQVPKPTLQRVLRRTAIFAPIILVLVFLTAGNVSTGQKVTNAILLIAIFIPFSYMVDVVVYRMFQRRQTRRG